jgi:hypothetical protein
VAFFEELGGFLTLGGWLSSGLISSAVAFLARFAGGM